MKDATMADLDKKLSVINQKENARIGIVSLKSWEYVRPLIPFLEDRTARSTLFSIATNIYEARDLACRFKPDLVAVEIMPQHTEDSAEEAMQFYLKLRSLCPDAILVAFAHVAIRHRAEEAKFDLFFDDYIG